MYITNKTNVCHTDDIWSLDFLDLNVYGPENKRGYRYISEYLIALAILVGQFLQKSTISNRDNLFWIRSQFLQKKNTLVETDDEEKFPIKLFGSFLKTMKPEGILLIHL